MSELIHRTSNINHLNSVPKVFFFVFFVVVVVVFVFFFFFFTF